MEEEDDDEVTFLLRLKPSPTPPTRRRKSVLDNSAQQTVPKGWDVVIERRDFNGESKEKPPVLTPKLQPSAPPQEILDEVLWAHDYRNFYKGFHSEGTLTDIYRVTLKT